MWRRRRSGLFIDFENVKSAPTLQSVSALVAWLEDGKFDSAGGKRRLLTKKIYWNSADERHRHLFDQLGFDVILCEKLAAMKNGADIRMALDISDCYWRQPRIEEYILFTKDTDFIPVLQRLDERGKRSAILVDELNHGKHSAYRIYADILIPVRAMREAEFYVRPARGWFGRPNSRTTLTDPSSRASDNAPGFTYQPALSMALATAKPADPMEAVERVVIRVTSRTPNQYVARAKILQQLRQLPGFQNIGANAYFGHQTYAGLMQKVAQRNQRIRVDNVQKAGASVMYVSEQLKSAS